MASAILRISQQNKEVYEVSLQVLSMHYFRDCAVLGDLCCGLDSRVYWGAQELRGANIYEFRDRDLNSVSC
jgi:hypothetical protein